MMAVAIGFDPALNFGNTAAAPAAGGALPQGLCGSAAAKAANSRPDSFHRFLRDSETSRSPSASDAATPNGESTASVGSENQPLEAECRPANRSPEGDAVWNALSQLIQSTMLPSGRRFELQEAPLSETLHDSDAGEEGQELLRFVDLLKQLQTLRGNGAGASGDLLTQLQGPLSRGAIATGAGADGALLVQLLNQLQANRGERPEESAELLSRLRELLSKVPAEGEGEIPNGQPGRIQQQLAQARELLAGTPWGRLVQTIAGQEASGGASAAPLPASGSLPSQAGDGPSAEAGLPGLPSLLRAALKQGDGNDAGASEAAKQPAVEPGAAAAAEKSRPVAEVPVPSERPVGTGESTASIARTAPAAPEHEAGRVSETPLPEEGSRRAVAEPPTPLATTIEDGGDDGSSAGLLRDARPAPMSETAADKTAAAGAALRQRETGGAAVKGDVVEQIVQRAALHLKNDQGEARIDLKPEFLGQVRMQVVTDSQQVTVRIVTELPMVRDLIEQNLHQLKSDLQQQGLQVERVEVSVADDPRRDAGRQDRTGGRRNGRGPDALEGPELGSTEQRAQTLSDFWSSGGRTTINMFV